MIDIAVIDIIRQQCKDMPKLRNAFHKNCITYDYVLRIFALDL